MQRRFLWAQRLGCFQLSRRRMHDGSQAGSIYESPLWTRGRMALSVLVLGSGSLLGYFYLMDSRAAIHSQLVMPLMHAVLDPEDSHKVAIWLAKHGLVPKQTTQDDPVLQTQLWGKVIQNPVGLAAGFDKNAEAIDGLLGFGFGTVEIGSVTPEPQAGNPLPRMFRLPADGAVINRYGFNSQGHEQVKGHLLSRIHAFMRRNLYDLSEYPYYNGDQQLVFDLHQDTPRSLAPHRLLGVNLGKNKVSLAESNEDYVRGIKDLGVFADYLVVNVSSPNTPGLRSLQRREPMEKLMREVKTARDKYLPHHPPLLVKIAPDLTSDEITDIASVIQTVGIDGVIISNTTISRPESLSSDAKVETGGLSGLPVKPLALSVVSQFYKATNGEVPIIGCGGIASGKDAIDFAKAGASLVQLYTSLGYQGPGLIVRMKEEMADILKKEGKTWKDVIGENHK